MSIYELKIPLDMENEEDSQQICRVFIGDSESFITLYDFCGEPRQWGMVLSDVANHLADMYQQIGNGSKEDILREIEAGYAGRMEDFYNMSGRVLPTKS